MLTELAAGATDAQALAELTKGRLGNKKKDLEAALSGTMGQHQRFILAQQLSHIDFLDEQIEALSQQVSQHKDTFLKARYHHLAARRGKKRAIVAIDRSILVSIWHALSRRQPYQDLGIDYYDQRRKDTQVAYFTKQLSKLGFVVSLDPAPTPV